MTTFKKDFLLLIRSKLSLITVAVFPFLICTWYLGISNSYIELLSIIPTYITLTLPLFGGLFSVHNENILINNKILKVVFSKIWVLLSFYVFVLVLSIPLLLSINQVRTIDPGVVIGIFISIVLFIFLSIILVQFIFRLFKGKIISYIISLFILLFLGSGKIFTGELVYKILEFVKVTPKLGRMYSGLVEISDIFYFIAFSSLLFLFAYFKLINKRVKTVLICFFIFSIFMLFNPSRMDLTSRGSYKINNVTLNTISKARVPVNITYYSSGNFGQIDSYLELFNRLDNVNYRKIGPEDSTFNSAVKSFKPIEIEDSGVHSFLVIEYLTRFNVIPLVSLIETLEFQLLKELDFLITGNIDSVGILIGDNEYIKDDFSVLQEVIENDFIIEYIKPGHKISDFIDCLIIIGHRDLNYEDIVNIGDYLSNGGSILIAANGVDISNNLNPVDTPLLRGLEEAGIKIEPYLIGDNDNIGIVDEQGRETPYPLNVITKPNMDNNGAYLSPFPGFNAIYLSPVKTNIDSAWDVLTTSSDSWLVDSKSGLQSNRFGSYSGAIYLETDLWKTFAGKESNKTNRALILGNTRSLTNLSYNLGISRGYDFIYRSIYYLLDKEDYLEVRHKFDYHDYNIKTGNELPHIYFHLFIYPVLVVIALLVIKRRFK